MNIIKEAINCEINSGEFFNEAQLKNIEPWETTSDVFLERVKKSKGLRFLLLASFHDAQVISIQRNELYGREILELFIDFKTAESNYFREKFHKFKIQFIHISSDLQIIDESKPNTTYFILATTIDESGNSISMEFEVFSITKSHGNEDRFKIVFEDAIVSAIK